MLTIVEFIAYGATLAAMVAVCVWLERQRRREQRADAERAADINRQTLNAFRKFGDPN